MREVILVAGPPCAGKSHYAAQHARPDDLILDQDQLGQRRMRQALQHVAAMPAGRAWVIRCAPGHTRRRELAGQIRADRVQLLVPPFEELCERAKSRPDMRGTMKAIREWLAIEAADQDPAAKPSAELRVSRSW